MPAARHAEVVTPSEHSSNGAATFDAGGPVATLQSTLAERLASDSPMALLAAAYAPDQMEIVITTLSRWAGYASLGVGLAGMMWLMFG